MLERVIEHWLTSATENGYMIPYCQVLFTQGHRVLHISRHDPFEQGKDIITQAPDGSPCAFQLKAGDITQRQLREISGELEDLVRLPIEYPGVANIQHRPYLVTTGVLREPARRDLVTMNSGFTRRGYPEITVIPKDVLLGDFVKAHGEFLPSSIPDFHEFMELLLLNGRDMLPKGRLAAFIDGICSSAKAKPRDMSRASSSVQILIGYALGNHYLADNHYAIIEGWVLAAAYILAMADKYDWAQDAWEPSFELALQGAEIAFDKLCQEISSRAHLVEGDALLDGQVYHHRVTMVLGIMCAFMLSRKATGLADWRDSKLDAIIRQHWSTLALWGESAAPFIFCIAWYVGRRFAPMGDEELVVRFLRTILQNNAPKAIGHGLADPYHDLGSCLRPFFSKDDLTVLEDFRGTSYSLRSSVNYLARRLRRQLLAMHWRRISTIRYEEYVSNDAWRLLLWHNGDDGYIQTEFPHQRQSWTELLTEARSAEEKDLPIALLKHPEFVPLFLCVFPHRFTPKIASYIDHMLA